MTQITGAGSGVTIYSALPQREFAVSFRQAPSLPSRPFLPLPLEVVPFNPDKGSEELSQWGLGKATAANDFGAV